MDIVDDRLVGAEREASPQRFGQGGNDVVTKKDDRAQSVASSSTSSGTSSASVLREEIGMSSVATRRDLERHPTALSRIETHRTQHSGTVGRSVTSRQSKKPLPNFGGGKDYPPPLPSREEYVVEFDGPEDPLHPLNWKLSKK